MKINISSFTSIILFSSLFVFLELSAWGAFGTKWWLVPEDYNYITTGLITDLSYTLVLITLCVSFLILSIKNTYYLIEKEQLVIKKGSKFDYIDYKNVLYIPNNIKKYNLSIGVILKNGSELVLLLDKRRELITQLQNNCKNCISKEELLSLFPNLKIK